MQASRLSVLDSYLHRLGNAADFSWQALVELLLIGAVIYVVLRFLEGTRGARMMQAVLVILTALLVLALVARLFQLDRIIVLYPYFVGGAFLIALVVFQPELRRGLIRIGEKLSRTSRSAQSNKVIEAVVQAAADLSKRKIGALVAIERRVRVGGLLETGVAIDALVTPELLQTIFWPGSALHDLGVIVSEGRIAAAGCEFPLSEADAANRIIGSRHRAALGMSLETDSLVVVVSEETGGISLAVRGKLIRFESGDELRDALAMRLLGPAGDLNGEAAETLPEPEPELMSDKLDSGVQEPIELPAAQVEG